MAAYSSRLGLGSGAAMLISVLLLTTAHTQAALRYETELEVVREDETEIFRERITAAGANARIDFINADGSNDGSYLATNDGGRSMVIEDGAKSICTSWSTSEFFQAAGEVLEKGRKTVKAKVTAVERSVTSEQAGAEYLGYPTRHLTMTTTYAAQGRFLFVKFHYEVVEVDEVWMSDQVDMPEFESQWLHAGTQTGSEFIDEHASKWNAFIDQPVLRHTNTITVTNKRNGKLAASKVENFRVTSLEALDDDQVDPALFAAPECEKVAPEELKHQAERMLKKYIK
jgi:hypothetical protein